MAQLINFNLAHSFRTAIGCKGNHSHEKIPFSGNYKYRIKEFYEITCWYVKERMDICSFCKKCVDCRKVLNITFFVIRFMKGTEKEMIVLVMLLYVGIVLNTNFVEFV